MKRWVLPLFFFSACTNPWKAPTCKGLAPPCPAVVWSSSAQGWNPCPLENQRDALPEDFTKEKSVTELLNLALSTNPRTKRTWAQAVTDAFAYEGSLSTYYPRIFGYYYFDSIDQKTVLRPITNNETISSSLGYYRTYTRELDISYLLFDFGGRCANAHAYKMALFSSNFRHSQSIQEVIREVLLRYYDYLSNKALLKAKKQDLRDARTNAEAAEAMFHAGLVTKVDVLQAKSTVANTILELQTLEGDVSITLGSFATALGLPANTPPVIPDMPDKIPIVNIEQNLDKLIAIAKKKRPDLNSYRALYKQRSYEKKVAVSNFLPNLTANVNLETATYTQSPILSTHNYDVNLTVNIPFFNGFADYFNIKNRNAAMYTAYEAWAEQESIVILEILTAYYNLQVAEENIKTSEEFLRFAEEAYVVTMESYKAGVKNFIDVLQTQSQLSTARAKRIVAITNYISSLSSLAFSAGLLSVAEEDFTFKEIK